MSLSTQKCNPKFDTNIHISVTCRPAVTYFSFFLIEQSSPYTIAHSSRQDVKILSGKSRRRDEEGYVLTPVDIFLCACL